MPNYCFNKITIKGSTDTIRDLTSLMKGSSGFDFANACGDGSREWRVENWGTAGEADSVSGGFVVGDSQTFTVSFFTEWSPSLKVTETLSRVFPSLRFLHQYEEGENAFSGFAYFKAGITMRRAEGDWDDFPVTNHITEDEDE